MLSEKGQKRLNDSFQKLYGINDSHSTSFNNSRLQPTHTFYDYYYRQQNNDQEPHVNNAITNLAIVKAAGQIRDTLDTASSQMMKKLASRKKGHHYAGVERSYTENTTRFQ